jgi:sarcosine oxidase subunit gamma
VLKPLTALGHSAPHTLTLGNITITERFDVALASLALRRGREKDLHKAAKSANLALAEPLRAESGTPFSSFWMTPEMWMIEADFAANEDIAALLKAHFSDAASITEQTDAWVRFDIASPGLTRLTERLTNLDLASCTPGFASRTVIDHLGTYLIKRSQTEITLYGPRASAQSLLHALEVTAASVL